MNIAYLLTGGNMGNRIESLLQAFRLIGDSVGKVLQTSTLYETAAWGITDQPAFLNQALQIETSLSAHGLLEKILAIELQMGRTRQEKMGPRLIDIDILFFNNDIINTEELVVPHPYLAERRFVLMPLAEIAAGYLHPVLAKTVRQLLLECPDDLSVKRYEPKPFSRSV